MTKQFLFWVDRYLENISRDQMMSTNKGWFLAGAGLKARFLSQSSQCEIEEDGLEALETFHGTKGLSIWGTVLKCHGRTLIPGSSGLERLHSQMSIVNTNNMTAKVRNNPAIEERGPTAAPPDPLSMELTIAARFLVNLEGLRPPYPPVFPLDRERSRSRAEES